MLWALLFMVGFGAITNLPHYSERALKDKINNLPGMPMGFDLNMFSGYVKISDTKSLFYWFIESENDPANDPVVLWTNGGPGCTGLSGLLTEQGPFSVTEDQKLMPNPYRWNKIANMIFFEQPVGVGFSWTSVEIDVFSDQLAADDNADFVEGWFDLFPFYKSNTFYISSESYGGHYMPQLSLVLLARGKVTNFKGMMVGNPWIYSGYGQWGFYRSAAGRNMFPKPEWDRYIQLDCPDGPQADSCEELANHFDTYLNGTYPQALDFPVCLNDSTESAQRPHMLKTHTRAGSKSLGGYLPKNYQPCAMDYGTTYLKRADVRSALHVANQSGEWSMCSDDVSDKWLSEDIARNVEELYNELVQRNLIKVLVFSGDDDNSGCSTFSTQKWLWRMNYTISAEWRSWTVDGQVAGYIVKFQGITFMTVHGAGHLVPQTRPEFALEMFRGYLNGTWF